jgi:hypothetical protein
LLSSVAASLEYCNSSTQPLGYEKLSRAMLALCSVVTGISAGTFSQDQSLPDTIETREEQACSALSQALELITQARKELGLAEDQRVSRVGTLLPDYIVPIFALLQMCANIMETFGWGKRKRKSRRCAAALADLAFAVAPLIEDMKACVARLSDEGRSFYDECACVFPDFLGDSLLKETSSLVMRSQQSTKLRIEVVLNEVSSFLNSFDIES